MPLHDLNGSLNTRTALQTKAYIPNNLFRISNRDGSKKTYIKSTNTLICPDMPYMVKKTNTQLFKQILQCLITCPVFYIGMVYKNKKNSYI
jgi:hypothetical protein